MSEQYGIVVDLDRCVACYACEVACKMEHNSAQGTPWIRLHTLGPHDVSGRLRMDYVPLLGDGCNLCKHRSVTGQEPICIESCPTQALQLSGAPAMLKALNNGGRHQICGIKEK